ncbi:hypothetical protein Tco_0706606 [Tanacetum coccineum]|uniref:Uncharacterized protein n=1 Tax=Tanacetum coccineum TaxID=301880 RepID=A0ABQ4Y9X6_9ASTR
MMEIVLVEEVYIEALQVKYPFIDWEIYSKEQRKYWKIIRVGNHTQVYQIFEEMLKKFDREDLDRLWSLVKKTFSTTNPTEDKEKELWVELKRLYEPDPRDQLWALKNICMIPWNGGFMIHVVFNMYLLEEDDFPKPVTAQTLPNEDREVNHTTSISRPQLKSTGLKDRVFPNNSEAKNKSMNVEEHSRNFNTKSVTACNDSLRTSSSNVNFVCATCGKYVLNDNHDVYVLSYINDMNSRTKKPLAVPISASEPKRTMI